MRKRIYLVMLLIFIRFCSEYESPGEKGFKAIGRLRLPDFLSGSRTFQIFISIKINNQLLGKLGLILDRMLTIESL